MIVVVEGPNGAGKTTTLDLLARELADGDDSRVRRVHNGPSSDPMSDYVGQLLDAMSYRREGVHTLIDRYNIGEQVYPTVFRRPALITPRMDTCFAQMLAERGVHTFVFAPPLSQLNRAHVIRDEPFDRSQLLLERHLFIEYVDRMRGQLPKDTLHVDVTCSSPLARMMWMIEKTKEKQ